MVHSNHVTPIIGVIWFPHITSLQLVWYCTTHTISHYNWCDMVPSYHVTPIGVIYGSLKSRHTNWCDIVPSYHVTLIGVIWFPHITLHQLVWYGIWMFMPIFFVIMWNSVWNIVQCETQCWVRRKWWKGSIIMWVCYIMTSYSITPLF